MDPINIAGILVSIIAGASAFAAQRAAARASTINTNTTSRVEMEKDAYTRARKIDVDTIERLELENRERREHERRLEEEIRLLENENRIRRENEEKLELELRALRRRVARLERGISLDSEEPINERYEDDHPLSQ